MQAKCPHCDTIFRLTDEQLSVANGKVRCGLCHVIFTATSIDDVHAQPVEQFADNGSLTSDLINTSTKEESTLENSNTASDLLFNEDERNKIFPDEYRALNEPGSSTLFATSAWSLGIVFLLVTLVSEYAWFNRNKLAHNPDFEPWIKQFCNISGCTIAPIHKPEQIEMVNRNVYTHPNIDNALMITATMVNKAPQAQAYPDVSIGFSNVRGKLVTQRIFSPEEYMKTDGADLRLLQPDAPVSFGIEIKDPGKQAMTYEFKFL